MGARKRDAGEQGTSPCKTQCPAHISIQGYIKKAGEGNYLDALKIIKRENPFPAVCGRICPHTCENECSRNRVDDAVAIDDIKKFIVDKELDGSMRYVPTIYEHYTEKVAVIGGGNAAIDAARAALRLGKGTVKMVCLESDAEMPTVPDDKDEAIAEGVQIENCWGPTRILGEDGKVTGVEFRRCLSTRNAEGRCRFSRDRYRIDPIIGLLYREESASLERKDLKYDMEAKKAVLRRRHTCLPKF